MKAQKARVIVLRVIKYGESDLIVHALNRRGARVAFFARGGAKSRKRFGGGLLEPTHYIEISYKEKPAAGDDVLHTLEEAQLIQGFEGLRQSYDRLQTAFHFLTVVSKLSQEGTIDSQELFDLLGNALKAAETSESLPRLRLQFEIKLLAGQGVLPALPASEDWLQTSIQEHAQVARTVTPEEFRDLEWQVKHSLDEYLGSVT